MRLQTVRKLQRLSKFLNLLLVVGAIATYLVWSKAATLPQKVSFSSQLQTDPIQSEADPDNFSMTYRGHAYVIQPMANYEITGLVVSKNDITAFDDIYHTSDSVDVQDLCMVWGTNADNQLLARTTFYSEPFSCQFRFDDSASSSSFDFSQVSNTHILSENDLIRRQVRKVGIGDQITMKGRLINYFPAGASEAVRKTSLRRDDTGNGACEVMLVDSLEVISAPLAGWRKASQLCLAALLFLVALKILLTLSLPYLELKAARDF